MCAEVIFDFHQIEDVILVMPATSNDLEKYILLIKRGKGWTTFSEMPKKFPKTYYNMIRKINEYFIDPEVLNEIYYKRFMQ
jgi:hypothetical protein